MNIENKSDLYIENNTIYEPKLGEYKIYIDSGDVEIWEVKYKFSLESTHIELINQSTGSEMIYFFKDYIFSINNQYCQIRGERIFIDGKSFNLNVYRGRLISKSAQPRENKKFVVRNNKFDIDGFYSAPPPSAINTSIAANISFSAPVNCLEYISKDNTHLFRNNDTEIINISNDSQNTHNVFILDYLVDIYNKLYIIHNHSLDGNFIEYIECEIDILNKSIILHRDTKILEKVLKYIKKNDGFLMRIENTETEILKIVWNLIKDKDNLIEIFLDNLIDIKSNYGFHCLTGRISRMLNTFSGINLSEIAEPVESKIKINKQLLTNEMMNICSKVRKELENENIDDDVILKERIKKKLIIDYVDTNILSIEELESVSSDWIQYIT